MKRKMIQIDEEKCNGCGQCIPNCPEGALQIIDGKARLVSDLFCDGLGACIGKCPQGALETVEREAEPYDERRVMENIVKQGANTIKAHLKHLKSHCECRLFESATDFLKERNIRIPDLGEPSGQLPCGCPGSMARKLPGGPVKVSTGGASSLRQWPVQLKLLNPGAEYFENADLLVSADCVAHACGSFHGELLKGRILIVFCPKLDGDQRIYVEKMAEIFRQHKISSVTVAQMEVRCCTGTERIVREAAKQAGISVEIKVKTITVRGEIQ
ncbi:MAG: 4Fe-4S binding protein [Victivallaceae bacterium]|nr:4Fe-4S binding protein [Victivallaceae bacterium]